MWSLNCCIIVLLWEIGMMCLEMPKWTWWFVEKEVPPILNEKCEVLMHDEFICALPTFLLCLESIMCWAYIHELICILNTLLNIWFSAYSLESLLLLCFKCHLERLFPCGEYVRTLKIKIGWTRASPNFNELITCESDEKYHFEVYL